MKVLELHSVAALIGLTAYMPAQASDLSKAINEALDSLNKAAVNKSISIDPADQIKLQSSIARAQSVIYELKGIYGSDDRIDVALAKPNERKAAEATAAFFVKDLLVAQAAGNFMINSSETNFCTPKQAADAGKQPERFYKQKSAAFCTGFKVGDDLIITAGHCIKDINDCNNTRIAFGYQAIIEGEDTVSPKYLPKEQIYSCKSVVDGELDGSSLSDWRLIKVERSMSGRPSVLLRSDGKPKIGTSLTVVGYPTGLPAKVAPNASVRAQFDKYFQANTDSYAGNSGSPVFNSESLSKGELLVEGILVRGEQDFEIVGGTCRVSKRCPLDGCRGEDVTYASVFASRLPH
jgi:hypothetical protein